VIFDDELPGAQFTWCNSQARGEIPAVGLRNIGRPTHEPSHSLPAYQGKFQHNRFCGLGQVDAHPRRTAPTSADGLRVSRLGYQVESPTFADTYGIPYLQCGAALFMVPSGIRSRTSTDSRSSSQPLLPGATNLCGHQPILTHRIAGK
jgi:hypothetical protein